MEKIIGSCPKMTLTLKRNMLLNINKLLNLLVVKKVFFVLLLLFGSIWKNDGTSKKFFKEYCALRCDYERIDHTVCVYEPCELARECGKLAKAVPLDDDERNLILELHNTVRNEMMDVNYYKHLPKPQFLRLMSYDMELEFIAQCWVNLCRSRGTNDKCRPTTEHESVGQNVYDSHGLIYHLTKKSVLDLAFSHWVSESVYVNASNITSYYPWTIEGKLAPGSAFIQIVAGDCMSIGCGRIQFGGSRDTNYGIVCNYGPSGLVRGKTVYSLAQDPNKEPCLGNNSFYTLLCGRVWDFRREGFIYPSDVHENKATKGTSFIWMATIGFLILLFSGELIL